MEFNELTGDEIHVAINALRVAAKVYDGDASDCRGACQERLAEGFDKQAAAARKLAERLEDEVPAL